MFGDDSCDGFVDDEAVRFIQVYVPLDKVIDTLHVYWWKGHADRFLIYRFWLGMFCLSKSPLFQVRLIFSYMQDILMMMIEALLIMI